MRRGRHRWTIITPLLCYWLIGGGTAESGQLPSPRPSERPPTKRVDLNTATVEELILLPSIGPVLAKRIVEHRRRHGRFQRPQELIIVQGMSASRYRKIAHLLTAGPAIRKE